MKFDEPTLEDVVEKAYGNQTVVLWRGTTAEDARDILVRQSAGGSKRNKKCGRPTDEQAKKQVGGYQGGSGSTYTKIKEGTKEYTTSAPIAASFARGRILCIHIEKQYLTKGSGSEGGWIARSAAPVVAQFIEYGQNKPKVPNAD